MTPTSAVRWFCGQHVRETPWDETPHEWYARATRTEAALNSTLRARINRADMNEVITTMEELESVEAGTHQNLKQNAALTVNNKPALLEAINNRLTREIAELLASAEPMARAGVKVPA